LTGFVAVTVAVTSQLHHSHNCEQRFTERAIVMTARPSLDLHARRLSVSAAGGAAVLPVRRDLRRTDCKQQQQQQQTTGGL